MAQQNVQKKGSGLPTNCLMVKFLPRMVLSICAKLINPMPTKACAQAKYSCLSQTRSRKVKQLQSKAVRSSIADTCTALTPCLQSTYALPKTPRTAPHRRHERLVSKASTQFQNPWTSQHPVNKPINSTCMDGTNTLCPKPAQPIHTIPKVRTP